MKGNGTVFAATPVEYGFIGFHVCNLNGFKFEAEYRL